MKSHPFHFNSDVGEGAGNDAEIMPFLEFCSIACGGHAGDDDSMDETIALAQKFDVKIGAHPSYPDKENFGRKIMDIPTNVLLDSIFGQIQSLKKRANLAGTELYHIKLHGALYNKAMSDEDLARYYSAFHKAHFPELALFVLPNSALEKSAKKSGIQVLREGFADRGYAKNGTLLSRSFPNAILESPDDVWKQLSFYSEHATLPNVEEKNLSIATFCVHGDHKNTVSILDFVTKKWTESR